MQVRVQEPAQKRSSPEKDKRAAKSKSEVLHNFVFEPGVVGMVLDDNGVVTEVHTGCQAERVGVRVGWRFVKVEGEPYCFERFRALIAGKGHYNVAFKASKSQLEQRGAKSGIAFSKLDIPPHTGIFKLHLDAQASLNTLSVHEAVKLPDGIDECDWIASHVIGVYDELIQLVSLLSEMCTHESCPVMNAGPHVVYSWADEKNKTPQKLAAPEYMQTLAEYSHEVLSDRSVLPIDGQPLPAQFKPKMQLLLRRFFRVYAHTYITHFQDVREAGCEAHLNCCFKRFLFFVTEFNLLSEDDMMPLRELIKKFRGESCRGKCLLGKVSVNKNKEFEVQVLGI
jgi:MOB kinase activator 1